MVARIFLLFFLAPTGLLGQLLNDGERRQHWLEHRENALGELQRDRVVAITIGRSWSTAHGDFSVSVSYHQDNRWQPVYSHQRYRENPIKDTVDTPFNLGNIDELFNIIRYGDSTIDEPWSPVINQTDLIRCLDTLVSLRLPTNATLAHKQKAITRIISVPLSIDTLTLRTVGNHFVQQNNRSDQRFGNHFVIDLTFSNGKGLRFTRPLSHKLVKYPASFWALHVRNRSYVLQSNFPQDLYTKYFEDLPSISDVQTLGLLLLQMSEKQ